MGSYLNPGSFIFRNSLNSKIYVDKSGLIEKTNEYLNTEQRFLCVSRPRRFGNLWRLICWRLIMIVRKILRNYLTICRSVIVSAIENI